MRTVYAVAMLAGVAGGLALQAAVANDPEARFRGSPAYDFGVTNVRWEAAAPDYSYVTFDLYWSFSWRAKWVEPAATSCIGRDIEVENWDAAWVFVKFLPDKDGKEAQERNHWLHAALDKNSANHVMPPGATNSVKLSDDGSRGMGVFIYRDAVGYGTNDWKNIKLRWLHPSAAGSGAAGGAPFDPAKAAVRVFPIPMVYVPQGPFKVGTGGASGISRFPDGPNLPSVQMDHMPGRKEIGSLTDGSWRGGPVVPFLVDEEWNAPASPEGLAAARPAAEGRRARRIGAAAGQLWTTLSYVEVGVGGSSIGDPGVLGDEYPTGYDSFYSMKYDVTQGQYVDYLNSLPPDVAAGRSCLGTEVGCDYPMPKSGERGGLTITVSHWPAAPGEGETEPGRSTTTGAGKGQETQDLASQLWAAAARAEAARKQAERKGTEAKPAPAAKSLPVYEARLPWRSCSGISRSDLYAYAMWTGLRPMSELEFEKARRGPRNPVPHENDTGTTNGVRADVEKDIRDMGEPSERFRRGNSAGGYGEPLTVFRVGCFATPTSDRVAANATYWGILEFGGNVVSALRREFRGTHGDGTSPAGKPGAALQRHNAPCAGREDWPKRIGGRGGNDRTWINNEYIDGRFVWNRARLVISADNRIKKAVPQTVPASAPSPAPAATPAGSAAGQPPRAALIRVGRVTREPGGKDYSTVSLDLAWDNSWRAKWEEPAEKNVTGKPLRLENRDAAWVFLKFRPAGSNAFAHAMLSPNAADHRVPAGAALDVGLSADGTRGVGVFIYRSALGSGANDFKTVKLRWMHPGAQAPAKDTPLRAYALEMVYVPQGAFQSQAPWDETLTTIRSANATDEWGRRVASMPPADAAYPNGYNAFYCAKFAISQGQYADYLNSLAPAQAAAESPRGYGVNRFTIRCDTNTGAFAADVPDRACNFLRWKGILNYEAWAGLRPLTELEYEKACRGPRAVARREDAWADGMCAPAAGIGRDCLPAWPDVDAGASYWGIRGLSLSGCVHEWPGIIFPYKNGKAYRGSHGDGSPALPPDWPDLPALGQYGDKNMAYGAVWMTPDNLSRTLALGEFLLFDNTGRYGARAVRTAPVRLDESAAVQCDALPNLSGYDMGIFWLTGRFRNEGDAPVKVEVAGLPDACFVEGAAARAFTAAPKTLTPFRVLVAVTRLNAVKASPGDNALPVQIRAVGGGVLAEQAVKLAMGQADAGNPPPLSALAGGKIEARLFNASDRPMPVSIVLDPVPECKPAETARRVEIPAGKEAVVAFPVPRQALSPDGIRGLPFQVTVGQGAAQVGEIKVNLQNLSRWWVGRKIKGGRPGAGGEPETGAPAVSEAKAPDGMPDGFFKMEESPRRWIAVEVSVTNLPLDEAGSLPSQGSSAIAGTKLFASAERDVKVRVSPADTAPDVLRIWVNESVVYDSRPSEKTGDKPFRIHAGMNTVAASWLSGKDKANNAAPGVLIFTDARTGQPVTDLMLDVEGK